MARKYTISQETLAAREKYRAAMKDFDEDRAAEAARELVRARRRDEIRRAQQRAEALTAAAQRAEAS